MFEGQKKLLGCGLLGEISSQADTMNRCSINLKTTARKLNPSKIGERAKNFTKNEFFKDFAWISRKSFFRTILSKLGYIKLVLTHY